VVPVAPQAKADPNVVKYFEKSGTVKSYKFDLYDLKQEIVLGTFTVKGDLAKFKFVSSQIMKENAPDYVYLNLAEKTAREYCIDKTRCATPGSSWTVEYDLHGIIFPPDWIESFKYGTKVRSLTFDRRQVNVLQYQADGKWYEAYIDPFYGYPLRVAIADDKEMTKIVGGYEYRSMAFNSVKDEEVTPPQ